jgi:L-lactate dehydrogenase (cytochrome)
VRPRVVPEAAVVLGARFTLIGRACLYGLMAGGREGVDLAIEILSVEIARTMRLLGVSSLEEPEPRHVTQLERLGRAVPPRRVSHQGIRGTRITP